MKKNIKDTPPKKRTEGVLLEDINRKLDIILEGYEAFTNKQNALEQKFERNRGENENNFKSVFQYLSRIDDELADIKKELKELKTALSKKADRERLVALEGRMQYLEAELAKYKNQIS